MRDGNCSWAVKLPMHGGGRGEVLLVTAGVQLINLGANCYLEIREVLLVTAGVQLMPNLGLEAAR